MIAATTSWGRMIRRSNSPAGRAVSRRPMKFLSADSIAWRTPSSVSTTRTRAVCNRATACETSDLTRKTTRVSSIDATSCSARRCRIRPTLPIPPFCNCQTAATSMSRREPLVFRSPLAPAEKLPAASNPVVVAGLRTIRFGRSGRVFSWRRSWIAAATSSCREAISGRLFRAIGIRSSGDRSEGTSVIWRNGGSIGSSSVAGSSRRTSARRALATRQSRMSTCWVCRRLWSSACARLISSGAIRLGASPLAKFTSSSALTIVAPTPSSLPRAA